MTDKNAQVLENLDKIVNKMKAIKDGKSLEAKNLATDCYVFIGLESDTIGAALTSQSETAVDRHLQSIILQREKRIAELEAALRFYAAGYNHQDSYDQATVTISPSNIKMDKGEIARKALAKYEALGKDGVRDGKV